MPAATSTPAAAPATHKRAAPLFEAAAGRTDSRAQTGSVPGDGVAPDFVGNRSGAAVSNSTSTASMWAGGGGTLIVTSVCEIAAGRASAGSGGGPKMTADVEVGPAPSNGWSIRSAAIGDATTVSTMGPTRDGDAIATSN